MLLYSNAGPEDDLLSGFSPSPMGSGDQTWLSGMLSHSAGHQMRFLKRENSIHVTVLCTLIL